MVKTSKKAVKRNSPNKNFIVASIFLFLIISLSFLNLKISKGKLSTNRSSPFVDYKKYEDYLETFLNKNPSYIDGYLELARVKLMLGKTHEAEEVIKTAADISLDRKALEKKIKSLY